MSFLPEANWRLREKRRRQRRKGQRITRRRRYKAEWREPKLVTIFEMDERGRMKRGTRAWIDGTFEGPNHLMELVAFHLHRLGAGRAQVVAFISDGAPWIWDRLEWVRQRVGLAANKTQYVLDWCHGVHHVSIALEQLTLADTVRSRIFRRLRQDLRAGRVQQVVDELKWRARGTKNESDVGREIRFLEKHEPHMKYQRLRRNGLPMGSGAIESAIRRVVNQRLKGNGIMWLQENAEAMLVLRAAALTDRWDQSLDHVRKTMAKSRRLDWDWAAPDIPRELQKEPPPKPPRNSRPRTQQTLEKTGVTAVGW